MDNIKQLLKEAFEAGIDRNHYNFNLVAGTLDKDDYAPDFNEWFESKLKNNGDLGDVVNCSNCNSDKIAKDIIFRCERCQSFYSKDGIQL